MMKIKSKLFEMCILENKSHMAHYRSPFMVPNLTHTSSFVLAALEKREKLLATTMDTGCLVYSKGLRLRSTHYSISFRFQIFLASEDF